MKRSEERNEAGASEVRLQVERVTEMVYCHQAMAARLAEDACGGGTGGVSMVARSQREVLNQMAMREIVAAVADVGLAGALLPADETEALLTTGVRSGMELTLECLIEEAAAFAVLAWILDGVHTGLAGKYRRMRASRLAMVGGCLRGRERVTIARRYL